MVSRSGRRRRPSRKKLDSPGGEKDCISALPDDLLLLVLGRIGCVRTAARTSGRWCGGQFWTRLPALVFRDVAVPSLEAALGRVSLAPPAVSLLEIRVPEQPKPVPEQRVHSLFRAAARLEPEELIFDLPCELTGPSIDHLVLDLPCFHRTTIITLALPFDDLRVPAGVELPTLETLSLSGCTVNVDALLYRCPRLRTLRLSDLVLQGSQGTREMALRVTSASLQELVVINCRPYSAPAVYTVHIVASVLKKLTVSLNLWEARISVLAPMLEKISWRCHLYGQCTYFAWRLVKVILQTPESQSSCISFVGEGTNITEEAEKHMIVEFSVLEIHLTTKGHVFGALISDLLMIKRICNSVQRLKVVLLRTEDEEECPLDCPCAFANWRSQTRALTVLEEVEINGFEGDKHEIDFLKLIFNRAPILKRMVVKPSHEASSSNFGRRKLYQIFRAWSSIKFCVHSTLEEYIFRRLD